MRSRPSDSHSPVVPTTTTATSAAAAAATARSIRSAGSGPRQPMRRPPASRPARVKLDGHVHGPAGLQVDGGADLDAAHAEERRAPGRRVGEAVEDGHPLDEDPGPARLGQRDLVGPGLGGRDHGVGPQRPPAGGQPGDRRLEGDQVGGRGVGVVDGLPARSGLANQSTASPAGRGRER